MVRHSFLPALVATILGLSVLAAPAQAAPAKSSAAEAARVAQAVSAPQAVPALQSEPTGCTTWIEWVHEGNSHYYGRGSVQCGTGRYKVKIQCRNLQTGVGYVVYGSQVVNAPSAATTTCNSGNVAESVHAVQDPPATGLTGCVSWMEWVHEGNSHYYGRGSVQCDTGRYQVQIQCRNLQTGVNYVVYGTEAVNAPSLATTTCYPGNRAQSVSAVPQ